MKNIIFFHYWLAETKVSKAFLLIIIILTLTVSTTFAQASPTTLSLADILIGLRSKKAALPEKNKLLADAVTTRGITFAVTDEIEQELAKTGATAELLQAIRQKNPAPKPIAKPAVLPSPEAVPVPSPTAAPDFVFYQNQANAFFVKGDYNAAVISYNKVIELNPKDPTAYLSRGLTYYNTKFYDLAATDFTKAIELSPKDSMSYFKRGDSYEKSGNAEKAIADYRRALELDSGNETAKTYLERLQSDQEKLAAKSQPTKPIAEDKKETASIKNSTLPKSINVGSLHSLAIRLEIPVYPAIERQRKTFGLVTVQISLDKTGKIISAKAIDGPSALRFSAETAARWSKFRTATFDGQPVMTTGFVTYNFKP